MAEVDPTIAAGQGDDSGAKAGGGGGDGNGLTSEARGQLEALKALRADNAKLKQALADIESQKEAAARKAAEEAGDHKRLWETERERAERLQKERDELHERVTAREQRVAASNEKRLSALPKELRNLVPDGLDADATAEQIARVEALRASSAGPPPPRGGHAGQPTVADVPAVVRTEAMRQYDADKRRRYTEEQWVLLVHETQGARILERATRKA